ncbi:MAG: hypothetical protein KTR18_12845 [Acidiferrobacterales bacterium]|nr:hypothetical protein [Acidiferrobacterales bacterium]
MKKSQLTRRTVLSRASVFLAGLITGRSASASSVTPKAAEGPFYPTPGMRSSDTDNDLVKVMGVVQEAGGRIILLKGKITNKDGEPQSGLRIEIWQCDLNGKYLHTGDNREITHDQGFQGFGHDITANDGSYQFRTIMPTKYPGRTPHIHVKVCTEKKELLTTQFYIQDHSDNRNDSLYRRMSTSQAESVSMAFTDGVDGLETTVNIVL